MSRLFLKYDNSPTEKETETSVLLQQVSSQILAINKQAYNLDRVGKREKAQDLYFQSTSLLVLVSYLQLVKKIYDRESIICGFSLSTFFSTYKLDCVISTIEKHFYKNVGQFVNVDSMIESIGLKQLFEDYLNGKETLDGFGNMFLTSSPDDQTCGNIFRLL